MRGIIKGHVLLVNLIRHASTLLVDAVVNKKLTRKTETTQRDRFIENNCCVSNENWSVFSFTQISR